VLVHPTVIKLGFLEWVEKRRKSARDGRLFPVYRYSRWWNEGYAPKVSVKTKNKVFHSFRGTFRDALKEVAKGDREAVDRIMGHYPEGTGAKHYGSRDLRPHESRLIDRVRFPFPLLS
jgi:integrase